jgi:hypothetical protein
MRSNNHPSPVSPNSARKRAASKRFSKKCRLPSSNIKTVSVLNKKYSWKKLHAYREENGIKQVLVKWKPSWERVDQFSISDYEEIKREWESRRKIAYNSE